MPSKKSFSDGDHNEGNYDISIAQKPSKRKAREQKPKPRLKLSKPPAQPRQNATVKELANGFDPADQLFTTNPPTEARILARIRKCLAVAKHAGTPETEARAALRMGSKLMSQYNVTQAEAFEDVKDEDQAQHGGHSIVVITATDDREVKNYAFTTKLASAICVFFDCKQYSTKQFISHERTFYGIASNTAAAAIAFEMTYNLISNWSMPKNGTSPNNSYSRGVADGLYDLALEEKRDEMRKTRENEAETLEKLIGEEQSARQTEIDRLNFQITASEMEDGTQIQRSASSEHVMLDQEADNASGDEGDDVETIDSGSELELDFKEANEGPADPYADFTTELKRIQQHEVSRVRRDPTPGARSKDNNHTDMDVSRDQGENLLITMWASEMQLVKFRNTANKIADEYLRERNVKLSNRSQKSSAPRDGASYKRGREDSRKIDVRRRRLE